MVVLEKCLYRSMRGGGSSGSSSGVVAESVAAAVVVSVVSVISVISVVSVVAAKSDGDPREMLVGGGGDLFVRPNGDCWIWYILLPCITSTNDDAATAATMMLMLMIATQAWLDMVHLTPLHHYYY